MDPDRQARLSILPSVSYRRTTTRRTRVRGHRGGGREEGKEKREEGEKKEKKGESGP